MKQTWIYYGALAGLTLLFVLLCRKKGRRAGLFSTALMAAGGLCLPLFTRQFAWFPIGNRYAEVTPNLSDSYFRFFRPSGATCLAAALFLALIFIFSVLRLERTDQTEVGP